MRLYKTVMTSKGGNFKKAKWDGTQADARARRREMSEDAEGWNTPTTEEVDVLTDKAGLLAWLNANCTGE